MNCKKLTLWRDEEDDSPKRLFGIILSNDGDLVEFMTGSGKIYSFNKKVALFTLEDTNTEFNSNGGKYD